MVKGMKKMMAVASTTTLEGLQQPVCLLLTLTAVELVLLQPLVQLYSFGEGGRLARDGGLAFMLVFGILIAGFTSGSTLVREIVRGLAATAVAKPVSRTVFLLGKFIGTLAVIAVFVWCSTFAVLFAERTAEHYIETESLIGSFRDVRCGLLSVLAPAFALAVAAFANWRWHRRLGLWFFGVLSVLQPLLFLFLGFFRRDGAFLGWSGYDLAMDFRIVSAALLVTMLLVIFVALATALSTRLQTGATVVASAAILFVGFLADSQFGDASGLLPRTLYAMVPDVQHFWVADALGDGGRIPCEYVLRAGGYAATYVAFVLTLGAWSFKYRDLG